MIELEHPAQNQLAVDVQAHDLILSGNTIVFLRWDIFSASYICGYNFGICNGIFILRIHAQSLLATLYHDLRTLADEYEYVMQGKLFKISEGSKRDPKAEVSASFGGLLMMLKGEASQFKNFELDQRMFLLIRKL